MGKTSNRPGGRKPKPIVGPPQFLREARFAKLWRAFPTFDEMSFLMLIDFAMNPELAKEFPEDFVEVYANHPDDVLSALSKIRRLRDRAATELFLIEAAERGHVTVDGRQVDWSAVTAKELRKACKASTRYEPTLANVTKTRDRLAKNSERYRPLVEFARRWTDPAARNEIVKRTKGR